MFEPHNLSSEEQNIDDELVEVRASDSSNQAKCDRVHNSQWRTCGKCEPMEATSERFCCKNHECEGKIFRR